MKIPYGMASFARIRQGGYFYADKTPFVPLLEDADSGSYGVLLRPRRSGKSLLLDMLANYYDLAAADRFDELFSGLYVHQHPTPMRSRYLVLSLDFSTMDTHAGPERLEATFVDAIRARVRTFLLRYRDLVPSYRDLLPKLDGYKSTWNPYIGNSGGPGMCVYECGAGTTKFLHFTGIPATGRPESIPPPGL